jgi:hypothetical protein
MYVIRHPEGEKLPAQVIWITENSELCKKIERILDEEEKTALGEERGGRHGLCKSEVGEAV